MWIGGLSFSNATLLYEKKEGIRMLANRTTSLTKTKLWQPWVIPILILLLWQVFGLSGWLSQRILPTPWEVLLALYGVIKDGIIFEYVAVSTKRVNERYMARGCGFGCDCNGRLCFP